MLRTSSYTIYADLPGNQEEMLVVQGYTGAYDKVSRRVATYLRSKEVKNPPKPLYGDWTPEPAIDGEVISPSQATIELLKRRGYLTEQTVEEEEAYFVELATRLHHFQRRLMPHYVFMPTYSCNLRCAYCFQDHMRTDPAYQHLLRIMQPEMVDRIFAAMPKIEAAHGVPEDADVVRDITFFGGEPLLTENRPIIEYTINKALSLGKARFSAITNGTDLEAYQDLIGPDKISYLQITVDGPAKVHDDRRIYADGSGSFDKIARNIDMALGAGAYVGARMSVDRDNIDQLPKLADEIIARGWNRYSNFSAYTTPIHAANSNTDIKKTFTSWDLDRALEKLHKESPNMRVMSRPNSDGLMDRARLIFGGNDPLPNFKASFCGAHSKMYLLDPFGDIYACWERTGDAKVRIGHINEDSEVILNEELNQTWRNRTVVSNPVCRKCRYSFACGGGCAVLAMNHKGKFHTNYCDGFANRFRALIAEAYLENIVAQEVMKEKEQEQVCTS
jgi:uncharacterized protein